jgi:prevent-host-death family protein
MKTMTAAKAKNAFGQMIEAAQREPVLITKQNRPVGVFMSIQDIENTIWGEEARKAHAEGYIGEEASRALMDKLLNARD